MKELAKKDVQHCVAHALESIAFILADSSPGPDADLVNHARIRFRGPDEESLVAISASNGFLLELASNMLGSEEETVSVEAEGVQALCELANIVCGEVVRLLGAEETRYEMGLPEHVEAITSSDDEGECAEVTLGTDEGCVHVRVVRHAKA